MECRCGGKLHGNIKVREGKTYLVMFCDVCDFELWIEGDTHGKM